jgi:hypothetical protein
MTWCIDPMGTLFFTDPPFGPPKAFDDRRKELPFNGVSSLKDGQLRLAATELTGPNGSRSHLTSVTSTWRTGTRRRKS